MPSLARTKLDTRSHNLSAGPRGNKPRHSVKLALVVSCKAEPERSGKGSVKEREQSGVGLGDLLGPIGLTLGGSLKRKVLIQRQHVFAGLTVHISQAVFLSLANTLYKERVLTFRTPPGRRGRTPRMMKQRGQRKPTPSNRGWNSVL
jgi:hypothetical protein